MHQLYLYRGVRLSNEYPGYDIKPSEGEAPALEIRGMRNTSSLPSPPDPLWPVVLAPDRIQSMGQIELFAIWTEPKQMTNAKLNCFKWNVLII